MKRKLVLENLAYRKEWRCDGGNEKEVGLSWM